MYVCIKCVYHLSLFFGCNFYFESGKLKTYDFDFFLISFLKLYQFSLLISLLLLIKIKIKMQGIFFGSFYYCRK